MERVRFIEHRGERVLLIDYSALDDEREFLAMIERRKHIVARQPLRSLLTLTDVTNARCSRAALEAIKVAAVLDRPHLKRAALVGFDTFSPRGATEAIATFSARHWKRFQTRDEALDWLVSDAASVSA
jgi:hypothetical protein